MKAYKGMYIIDEHGIFNAYNHFLIPAFASLNFPLCIVICLILLKNRVGIYSLAIGAILGAFFQFFISFVLLIKKKKILNLKFYPHHPGVQKLFKLIPVFSLVVLFNQIDKIVIRSLASTLQEGSISSLNFAY